MNSFANFFRMRGIIPKGGQNNETVTRNSQTNKRQQWKQL